MATKIAPITFENHGKTKIKPLTDFSIFKERHVCPLTVHEFARANSCFPIIFLKKPEVDEYNAVAMFSIVPNKNAFVTDDGAWNANYLPQHMARVPYCVSNDENPVICLDESSSRVNEEEGAALFNEDGGRSEYFEKIIDSIQSLINQDNATRQFVAKLSELELLQESNLTISKKDGSKQEITGIYLINENKFKELTDEQVLELNKSGFLGLIYMHFASLGQTQNVAKASDF